MTASQLAPFRHRWLSFFAPKLSKKSATQRKKNHATETTVSQSLAQVLTRLSDDCHRKVLVIGSKTFHEALSSAAPDLTLKWASYNMEDVFEGATPPDRLNFAEFEAVVCGGLDVIISFRTALAKMAGIDRSRPVHWVADDWEFCGGTFPVPAEADDAQVVLFNHFQHFFGIKDHLQFHIQVVAGKRRLSFSRILGPNESLVFRASDYVERSTEALAFSAFVSHPTLTRGRHYRLRMCGDVFWKRSFTTLHGVHEFNRSPKHKFEFRQSVPDLRGADIVLTVPNFARDLQDSRLISIRDSEHFEHYRNPENFVEEVRVSGFDLANKKMLGWQYAGYGGSNWYALAGDVGPENKGSIAGNHHASVPVAPSTPVPMGDAEKATIQKLRESGYFLEPYPLPIARADDPVRFGFSCGSANPAFNDFIVHLFDGEGHLIVQRDYKKDVLGTVFTEELLIAPEDFRASLALITPNFEKIGLARRSLKTQFEQVVESRSTRDWDVTEGQTSWRNTGILVPGVAHFAGPTGAVVGRTNLVARARSCTRFRTAVVAAHASGNINYRNSATLKVTVLNALGVRREADVEVPSFTWRCIWLDDIWPDLGTFLGNGGFGPLLATSLDADINCQIMTTSTDGAVSLQHMWGY